MAEPSTGVKYSISIDDSELKSAQDRIANSFSQITESAVKEGNAIDSAFRKLGGGIAAIFTVQAAANFTRQIVAVRKEVESLEISFRTLLGNEEKANALLGELREFAVKTPLQLNDLAKSAQTLLSFNVEAEKVMPTLRAIGDISMGDAQKMQSLTLAFAQMSSTGKLMGQDLLQMINAGFNPLTVIAEQTGKSVATLKDEMSKGAISAQMVTDAFMAAASEGGKFNGMLEKQSESVAGAFSNLQGALQDMMNGVGQSFQEPLADALGSLTKLVQNYDKFGGVLASTVATFGAYKAACMAVAAAESVATAMKGGHTIATLALEKAQALLNKTMLANPYVAIAAATAAIVTGIIAYTRRTRDARTEQQKLNDMLEQGAKVKQELKDETEQLIATATNESSSNLERHEALKKLKAMYPDYLADLKTETELTETLAKLRRDLPELADENEISTLKKQASDLGQYVKLMREYNDLAQRRKNSYKVGDTDEQRAKIDQQMDSLRAQIDEINKRFDGSVVEAARKAGYKTVDEFLNAYNTAAAQRRHEMEEAKFEAAPINVKIAVTDNTITKVQMQIANTKRQIEQQPWNIQLKFNLNELEGQLNELEGRKAALEDSQKKSQDDYSLKGIKNRIKEQQDLLRNANRENDKEAAQKAQDALDEAKKDYKLRTGKDYDSAVKEAQNLAKEQKKIETQLIKEKEAYERTLLLQTRAAAREREQVEIDIMEEGAARKERQLYLDYQRRIDAADDYERELLEKLRDIKEKEWEAENQPKVKHGETFNRESVTADMLTDTQKAELQAKRDAADQILKHDIELAKKEADALLNEYRDLQTKIQAIEERYNKLREQAGGDTTTTKNIDKAQNKEIAALILDSFKAEEAIGKVAEQIQSLGQAARTALQNNLQRIVDFVTRRKEQNGLPEQLKESVAEFAALNNVSEEFLNTLLDSDTAFEQFVQYVSDMGRETAEPINNIAKAIENFKAAKDKATKSGDIIDIDNLESAQQLLEDMTKQMADNILSTADALAQMFREIADMTGNDALAKVGDAVSDIVGNIQAAEAGAQAWGGWWGAIIGGLVDMIPKIIKWVNLGNAESLESIEKQLSSTEQMLAYWKKIYEYGSQWTAPEIGSIGIQLADLYAQLEKAEKAYNRAVTWAQGKSGERKVAQLRKRRDDLLAEIEELENRLSNASSPTREEAYNNTLSNYDKRIEELQQRITALKKHARKNIDEIKAAYIELAQAIQDRNDFIRQDLEDTLGFTATSLASQISDSLASAFDSGSDAAKAFGNTVSDVMRNVVKNIVMTRVIEDKLNEMFNEMALVNFKGQDPDMAKADYIFQWLHDNLEPMIEGMGEKWEEAARQFGWDTTTAAIGASRGIATATSQDSVDLNGRMTVIQAHTASLVQSSALSASNTTAMLSALNGIHSDTSQMRTDLNAMRTDLNAIRNNM